MPHTTEQMAVLHPEESAPVSAPIRAESSGSTHPGTVREENQDHYLIAELWQLCSVRQTSLATLDVDSEAGVTGHVLAVADGMGGHPLGALASRVALEGLRINAWLPRELELSPLHRLETSVRQAEASVKQLASADSEGGGHPGTTLTMALVAWPQLYLAHVGDSRAYLVRGEEAHRLTQDHTLAGWLEREDESEGQSRSYPERFHHVLMNAIGGDTPSARIDLSSHIMEPGDTLLLCSDGLVADIADDELAHFVARGGETGKLASALVDEALARGARDNVTAAVIQLEPVDGHGLKH